VGFGVSYEMSLVLIVRLREIVCLIYEVGMLFLVDQKGISSGLKRLRRN
jgi:hypothetical protein